MLVPVGYLTGSVALVGAPLYKRNVDVRPTWDLLDRLDAAADDARNIHNDLCGLTGDGGCSCGVPALLRELAQVLRVKDAYALLEAGELGSLAA